MPARWWRRHEARTARAGFAIACALSLCILPGCFTFSSYQSARIVEKGQECGTVAVSRGRIVEAGPDEELWWAIEGGVRFGIAKRVDASFLLSVFADVQEDWGVSVLTVDVRGGLADKYLTAVLPVSVTMGDFYLASLRVQPGIVMTLPLGDRLELNGSVRAHVFVRIPDLFAMGYTIGLGLISESGEWAIRPELGWMQFTAERQEDTYAQYGIAVEKRGLRKSAEKEKETP